MTGATVGICTLSRSLPPPNTPAFAVQIFLCLGFPRRGTASIGRLVDVKWTLTHRQAQVVPRSSRHTGHIALVEGVYTERFDGRLATRILYLLLTHVTSVLASSSSLDDLWTCSAGGAGCQSRLRRSYWPICHHGRDCPILGCMTACHQIANSLSRGCCVFAMSRTIVDLPPTCRRALNLYVLRIWCVVDLFATGHLRQHQWIQWTQWIKTFLTLAPGQRSPRSAMLLYYTSLTVRPRSMVFIPPACPAATYLPDPKWWHEAHKRRLACDIGCEICHVRAPYTYIFEVN